MEQPPSARSIRDIIGKNVKRLRTERGLTAEQLAKRAKHLGLNWTPARVSELEAGVKAVGLSELVILAHSLSLDKAETTLAALLETDSLVELTPSVHVRSSVIQNAVSGQPVKIAVSDSPQLKAHQRRLFSWLPSDTNAFLEDFQRYGGPDDAEVMDIAASSAGSAEVKAARALGVRYGELIGAAVALWGHSMTVERDDRAAGTTSKQAKGHVTRDLIAELNKHIEEFHGNDRKL